MFTFGHIVLLFLTLVSPISCLSIKPSPSNQEQPQDSNQILDHEHKPIYDQNRRFLQQAAPADVVNVDTLGAKGDGTDDSKAFEDAWKAACGKKDGVLLVPKGKVYHLHPMKFVGPCKPSTTFMLEGDIKAVLQKKAYEDDLNRWLVFESVDNLIVRGGGTINGNGKVWWEKSCKVNKNLECQNAPTGVTFYECNNLQVDGIRFRNAQQMQCSFQNCVGVKVSNVRVQAPDASPNTDGLHITATQNIEIVDCIIGTGDDCISIKGGSKNVTARGITCGPGHGISIGSLGKGGSTQYVSDVLVDGARFSGADNGARIKTWQGGSGSVKNVVFQNIVMKNVQNPIIVDQQYCDQKEECKAQSKAVAIENVVFKNIKGTSRSKVATTFDCSKNSPCKGIVLEDINLTADPSIKAQAKDGVTALCNNVDLKTKGVVLPACPK